MMQIRRFTGHLTYTNHLIYASLAVTAALFIGLGVAPHPAAGESSCKSVAIPPPPLAAEARSRVHSVQIAAPVQFDFTLASLTLSGSTAGLSVTVTKPTRLEYVAAAALCDAPQRIFVLVVNRLPRGSLAYAPASVALRIKTRSAELAPAIVQHIDILAHGASGQDCSPLTYYPGLGHPYLWGYELKPLTSLPGRFGASETVAHALDQACSDSIDSQFERWVGQEPQPAHP